MRTPVVRRILAVGRVVLTTAVVVALASAPAAAQDLRIPVTTVLGTDVFSGPSFTIPSASATDTSTSLMGSTSARS